jgi:hypothetical protein
MTMETSSTRNHRHLTAGEAGAPRRLFGALLIAAISLLFAYGGLADAQTRVGWSAIVPKTQISCFHKKIHRFTAETKPRNCELAGHEGEQNEFVRYPIQNLRWHEWGRYSAEGSRGIVNGQIDVRVIAYRRVRCKDGRTFYSEANVVEPGNGSYYVVRFPTCDDDALLP